MLMQPCPQNLDMGRNLCNQLISILFCLEQIGTDVIVGWRTESGEAVIQDRLGTRMLLVDSVVVLMTMGSIEM